MKEAEVSTGGAVSEDCKQDGEENVAPFMSIWR